MASTIRAILSQVKTTLATINGAGSYTYDLSAAGRVTLGLNVEPPMAPYVCIGDPSVDTSVDGMPLGYYERRGTIPILGWIDGDGSEGSEMLSACDLLEDLMLALEADRSLNGNVRDLQVSAQTIDGSELQIEGWGLVVASLEVVYAKETGS